MSDNIENAIYELYHLSKNEKVERHVPQNISPIYEEIWRSVQLEEANVIPKKMSKEATITLMRILDDIDSQKLMTNPPAISEDLIKFMKIAEKVKIDTDDGKKKLTMEQFQQICSSYDSWEGSINLCK